VEFANGVGFSPDGQTLYHSNYSAGVVLAHDLGADGVARNRRVFARVSRGRPDGLAVDEAGGVWVALGSGAAIARFTPGGDFERAIEVPGAFVASLGGTCTSRRRAPCSTRARTSRASWRGSYASSGSASTARRRRCRLPPSAGGARPRRR